LFENKTQGSQKKKKIILRIQKGTQNDNDDNNDKAKIKRRLVKIMHRRRKESKMRNRERIKFIILNLMNL